jgi:hypothetical protein
MGIEVGKISELPPTRFPAESRRILPGRNGYEPVVQEVCYVQVQTRVLVHGAVFR